MMGGVVFVLKLLGALVVGGLGSIVGSNVDNELPALARRLVRAAARWHPEHDRERFIEETLSSIDECAGEGRNVRAFVQFGATEWSRAAITRGAPAWLASEHSNRLGAGLFAGLFTGLSYGLVFGLVAGLFVGLGNGLVFGLFVGLFARMVRRGAVRQGQVVGLVTGLAVGLFAGLAAGVAAGVAAGLAVGRFGPESEGGGGVDGWGQVVAQGRFGGSWVEVGIVAGSLRPNFMGPCAGSLILTGCPT